MKVSRLKEIIREEYYNVMNEGFADPEIRKLARLGGLEAGKWTNFFRSFAKTHNIAWDKLPPGTLNKTTTMSDPLIKDGLAFWVIEDDKENPYGGDRYFDRVLRKGVLAVTLQGRPQYYSRDGMGPKGGYKQGQAAGRGVRGTLQLKKLKELADYVYVMDFESFRGGTKALKATRAELKLGKDTFKDAKAWKQANLSRYKSIIDARVGSRDQVDRMTAEIVKIANEAITTGMEVTKMGKYGDLITTINGNEVNMNSVTNAMTRILRTYAEYIRFENDEEKESYSKDFYKGRKQDAAGKINKALKAFKSGNARQIDYI
jgi:hypothetical protein